MGGHGLLSMAFSVKVNGHLTETGHKFKLMQEKMHSFWLSIVFELMELELQKSLQL